MHSFNMLLIIHTTACAHIYMQPSSDFCPIALLFSLAKSSLITLFIHSSRRVFCARRNKLRIVHGCLQLKAYEVSLSLPTVSCDRCPSCCSTALVTLLDEASKTRAECLYHHQTMYFFFLCAKNHCSSILQTGYFQRTKEKRE